MNCECLDVNMWMCRLITLANKNKRRQTREFCGVLVGFSAISRTLPKRSEKVHHMFFLLIEHNQLFIKKHLEEFNADVLRYSFTRLCNR